MTKLNKIKLPGMFHLCFRHYYPSLMKYRFPPTLFFLFFLMKLFQNVFLASLSYWLLTDLVLDSFLCGLRGGTGKVKS